MAVNVLSLCKEHSSSSDDYTAESPGSFKNIPMSGLNPRQMESEPLRVESEHWDVLKAPLELLICSRR